VERDVDMRSRFACGKRLAVECLEADQAHIRGERRDGADPHLPIWARGRSR
jgi:hypothetical protein